MLWSVAIEFAADLQYKPHHNELVQLGLALLQMRSEVALLRRSRKNQAQAEWRQVRQQQRARKCKFTRGNQVLAMRYMVGGFKPSAHCWTGNPASGSEDLGRLGWLGSVSLPPEKGTPFGV
jgi:hypothetical protein